MTRYTVRFGDTLWDIAERCYGDGHLWQSIVDRNPLARAGVLYEGQCLEVPAPPARPPLIDPYRHALPLGHVPVRIRLDGKGPLLRYDGFGVFALSGLTGELTFHRHGNVHLGELSVSRLLGYRLEQVAWARDVFVEHFCTATVTHRDAIPGSTGPEVTPEPYHLRSPGYTITGRVGVWWITNVHRGLRGGSTSVTTSLVMNPSELFDLSTLVLEDIPAALNGAPGQSAPLGRALRAACPLMISPAELWALTRDESCLRQPAAPSAAEPAWAAPPGRKPRRKKPPSEKAATRPARPRARRSEAAPESPPVLVEGVDGAAAP